MNKPAPEWDVIQWFNTPAPITLESLRGRVVVVLAFQMLCPGCVARAIPQMIEITKIFPAREVAAIGLHTVFEHHEGMGAASLAAFLHEYRVGFPVGIDLPGVNGSPTPSTMTTYGMRGTPTYLLIDRGGNLAHQQFGHVSDMELGARVADLVGRPLAGPDARKVTQTACDPDGCTLPA